MFKRKEILMLDYNNQDSWYDDKHLNQSPVDLVANDEHVQDFLPIYADKFYQLTQEINDETTIRLTGFGNATIFNREFEFQQIHFHAPAEHTINGKQLPFEIHLVHQNKIGQTVVVAILPKLGNSNPTLQAIINNFNADEPQSVSIKLENWIARLSSGFHYQGSLTTPPLTEGVEWVVIDDSSLTVSQNQIDWFIHQFGKNNRDTQALNGRQIEHYSK